MDRNPRRFAFFGTGETNVRRGPSEARVVQRFMSSLAMNRVALRQLGYTKIKGVAGVWLKQITTEESKAPIIENGTYGDLCAAWGSSAASSSETKHGVNPSARHSSISLKLQPLSALQSGLVVRQCRNSRGFQPTCEGQWMFSAFLPPKGVRC